MFQFKVTTDLILLKFNLIERYYANDMVPTGERLRFYLQAILSLHMISCKLTHNPAGWEAMEPHIGKIVKKHKESGIRRSQPGVHLEDMGRFLYELQRYQVHKTHGRPNKSFWLELIYLTGSSPGEGRKAQWGEIVRTIGSFLRSILKSVGKPERSLSPSRCMLCSMRCGSATVIYTAGATRPLTI